MVALVALRQPDKATLAAVVLAHQNAVEVEVVVLEQLAQLEQQLAVVMGVLV
jgi:hypothetical protein